MPKLQKRPPPAYPGVDASSNTNTLVDGVRYENLPPATQQPVYVTAGSGTAVLGALGTTPTREARSTLSPSEPTLSPVQATSRAPSAQVDSPVSPLMDDELRNRSPMPATQLYAPQPQRPGADARRSVELRTLNGKPYPATKEGRTKVKVAKDMHDGALPPVYKRQDSNPINPTEVAQAISMPPPTNSHDCQRCGKRRSEGDGNGHSCTRCGKRKSSVPSAAPPAAPAPTHARALSEGSSAPRVIPSIQSVAGPSADTTPRRPRCCDKCGRAKRPATDPIRQTTFDEQQRRSGQAPIQHPSRAQQAGLHIQPAPTTAQSVQPVIDVVPPTASTYKPINSPFSTYGDDSPLVAKATKQEFRLFRNSSIARSFSRRMSKRAEKQAEKQVEKHASAPLPSQQHAANQTGEQSAGRLINMISSAIREPNQNDRGDVQYSKLSPGHAVDRPPSPFSFQIGLSDGAGRLINMISSAIREPNQNDRGDVQYSKLSPGHAVDRPSSPFSFVDAANEDEAFEMKEMADKEPIVSVNAMQSEETLDVDLSHRDQQKQKQVQVEESNGLLSPPASDYGKSRPPVSRFKSLRGGVRRMGSTASKVGSITRSTSLRRFESMKTVHRNWYRDDMALEGASYSESSVPVF